MRTKTALQAIPAEILVDSKTAAEILVGMSHENLRVRRLRGLPPKFIRFANGRIRYSLTDLAKYEDGDRHPEV